MTFIDYRLYLLCALTLVLIYVLQRLIRNDVMVNRVSKSIILAVSLFVMYTYDYRFLLCIIAAIVVTYVGSTAINRSSGRLRGFITCLSVILLVVILGYFKYFNFFMDSLCTAMGKSWSTLEIILPIGISYYIFSAIAYLLDVNWQTIEYNGNVLDIALYMAFFPKVVCGPIANAKEFLPQLKEKTRITSDNISLGLQIVVMGLFKKLVIAGNLGLFVDDVYAAPAAYATITVWLAVFSYFVELYFDFSGYSDIAIGISRLFGYKIERNFNLPFVSRNISEFWERWHISLSTWLNEYIFNPVAMGLRRKIASLPKDKKRRYKNIPTYVALIVTFLVCGIWHGAGWTFILWGLLQGICSCIHERYVNYMKKNHRNFAQNKGKGVIVADIVANFFTMNMIQMVMRASSVGDVVIILRRMFTQQSGIVWFSVWIIVAYIALIAEMILAYHKNNNSFRNIQGVYLINDLSTVKGLTLFFIFVGITAIFGYFGDTNFIYAQF